MRSVTDRESAGNCRPNVAGADASAVVQHAAYRGLLGGKGRGRTDAARQLRRDSGKEQQRGEKRLEAHGADQECRSTEDVDGAGQMTLE